MEKLLIAKQTEEQIYLNMQMKHQFIIAMMNADERMIGSLLEEDKFYLDGKNKWHLQYWFKNRFRNINREYFNSHFTEGVSTTVFAGSTVLEFRYLPGLTEDDMMDGNMPSFSKPGTPANRQIKEVVIRLVVSFENGKIKGIGVPKTFNSMDKLKQFLIEN